MFEELESLFEARTEPFNLKVSEIKEKYAGMRVDIVGVDLSNVLPEVYDIIEKYERLSEQCCDTCGANGSIREIKGWLTVYCDSCFKIENEIKPEFRRYDINGTLHLNGIMVTMQTPFRFIDVNGNERVGKKQTLLRGPKYQGINATSQTWASSMRYYDVNGRSHIW